MQKLYKKQFKRHFSSVGFTAYNTKHSWNRWTKRTLQKEILYTQGKAWGCKDKPELSPSAGSQTTSCAKKTRWECSWVPSAATEGGPEKRKYSLELGGKRRNRTLSEGSVWSSRDTMSVVSNPWAGGSARWLLTEWDIKPCSDNWVMTTRVRKWPEREEQV